MAPPCFSDLGKSARDILNKGYHLNTWKVEAKASTDSGVKFKSTGVHNTENGKVLGVLESEYSFKDYGLKFVDKWSTDNVFTLECSLENKGIEGLKLTAEGSFNPSSGNKRGQLKTNYKNDFLNLNLDVDSAGGATVRGAGVASYNGFLAGYQSAFDVSKSQLISNNLAFGLDGGDFSITANVNDGQEFLGAVHHKVSRDLETGVTMGWAAGASATTFNFGVKYNISDDTNIKIKVTNQSLMGVSLQQRLKDGLSLTLSGSVDVKNLNTGRHAVGLSVEYEQ